MDSHSYLIIDGLFFIVALVLLNKRRHARHIAPDGDHRRLDALALTAALLAVTSAVLTVLSIR